MFKTHATVSFLFVHTQFKTIIGTNVKTTTTITAATTKVDPFSSFSEPSTRVPVVVN